MSPSGIFLFALLISLAYLVAPSMLVWGWMRWAKQRPRLWTITSTFSFLGFLLASASGLFAFGIILYGESGGFEHTGSPPFYSPNYSLLYECIRWGVVLSLMGLLFSIGGVWHKGLIRWQALASAIGTLAFWLLATTWP